MKSWCRALVTLVLGLVVIALGVAYGCAKEEKGATPTPVAPTVTTTKTVASTATVVATVTATPTAGAEQPQKGGTLRIIWSNTPASGFGFAPKIFGGEGFAADPAMESLMESKFTGGEFVMRLATGYDISDDGLSITFTLRRGVKFHDGTDFDAEAVKFNFDAMMEAGRLSKNIKSVEVVDKYTVKFVLEKWRNTALGTIGGVVIASPTAVRKNGVDWAATHAVGTGPFKQVSYEPDVKIRLERFDGYWGEKAYLDAIEGTFIADPVTQVMAMQAGQGDVTHSRQAKVIYDLKQAGFNILQNYMGMVAANFDSRNPNSPWANLKVRQAFDYAVNKQAIVDTLGYGYWKVAYQFALPGQNGYLDDIVPREYNPDKAKQLLAEAGYPNGFRTKLIHAIGDFEDGAVAVQRDLAKVGITADIEKVDWAKWGAMRQQGWEGIFLTGSGIIANWNSLMEAYFAVGRTEMYSILRPEGFQDLIEQALSARPENPELTKATARVVYDMVLWSPIKFHGDNYAYTSKVHGLNFGTYGQWGAFDSEKVWLSK
ncbi:MAG: ABC transporter substrate-binding protein [Dehalococcoidales bacterium]|nr:ABC transporter substrate-binding protein [Dehalococcoidales bacterium]